MFRFPLELEIKQIDEIEITAMSVCKIIFVERAMLVVFTIFKSCFKLGAPLSRYD